MAQIEIYKQQQIAFYTTDEKQMIEAKKSNVISQIDKRDLFEKLKTIIKAVYFKAGFEIKGNNEVEIAEQIILLTQAFMQELLIRFSEICISEIEIALNNGIYKKYGEYMALSSVTFITWIDKYYEQRRDLIFKQRQIEEKIDRNKEIAIPNPEQIENDLRKLSLEAFEKFKKTGFYNDYGNCVYDYLNKKGMIKFSSEEKNKFMFEAKLKIAEEDKEKRFKDFLLLIERKDKKATNIVVCEAKRIALNKYFSTIKKLTI